MKSFNLRKHNILSVLLLFIFIFIFMFSTNHSYSKKDLNEIFGEKSSKNEMTNHTNQNGSYTNNGNFWNPTIPLSPLTEDQKIILNQIQVLVNEQVNLNFLTSSHTYNTYQHYLSLPNKYYLSASLDEDKAKEMAENGLFVLNNTINIIENNPSTGLPWNQNEMNSEFFKLYQDFAIKFNQKINTILSSPFDIPNNSIQPGSILDIILKSTILSQDNSIRLNIINNTFKEKFSKQEAMPTLNAINKIISINNKLMMLLGNSEENQNQVTLMEWLLKEKAFASTIPTTYTSLDILIRYDLMQIVDEKRNIEALMAYPNIKPLATVKLSNSINNPQNIRQEHNLSSVRFRIREINHGLGSRQKVRSSHPVSANPTYIEVLNKLKSFNDFFIGNGLGHTNKTRFENAMKISNSFANLYLFVLGTINVLPVDVNYDTFFLDYGGTPIAMDQTIGNSLFSTITKNIPNDITFMLTDRMDQRNP